MYPGKTQFVTNKQRKFGAADKYVAAYLQQDDNVLPTAYLFTETQLMDAKKRAEENKEDIPKCEGNPLDFPLLFKVAIIGVFIGLGISLFL